MVIFEDKNIVEDPVEDLELVHKPNEAREGPVHSVLTRLMTEESGGSYHNTDPNRGHLSASDGCKRRSYLNYVHKLDEDLDVPPNDNNTNWTFKHGDAVHELIQELLAEKLGHQHVTNEETVSFDLGDEKYIYGHADVVLRGLNSVSQLNEALPSGVDFSNEEISGFPDPFVIDIKTKSEFTYYNRGKGGHARSVPKESNIMQLNGYMGIIGAQYGCLLYYSKRNDWIEEYWIEFDEELFEEAKRNIEIVLDSVETGTPAPRDPDGAYMCERFCKWYKTGKCPGADEAAANPAFEGDDTEFEYEDPEWG